MQFASKNITLVQNIPGTITWTASDFSRHLGAAIIPWQVSVSLSVVNSGSQVAYIGFQCNTLTKQSLLGVFNVGVPAGASKTFDARQYPQLAGLGPDITMLIATVNMAAAGNVSIALDINEAVATTAIPAIGGDVRATADYIRVSRFYLTTITPGGVPPLVSGDGNYIVPSGKRAYIEHLQMQLPPTAYADSMLYGYVTINGDLSRPLAIVRSNTYETVTYQLTGQQINLEAGEYVQMFCANAYVAQSFNVSANVSFIEYY